MSDSCLSGFFALLPPKPEKKAGGRNVTIGNEDKTESHGRRLDGFAQQQPGDQDEACSCVSVCVCVCVRACYICMPWMAEGGMRVVALSLSLQCRWYVRVEANDAHQDARDAEARAPASDQARVQCGRLHHHPPHHATVHSTQPRGAIQTPHATAVRHRNYNIASLFQNAPPKIVI